MQEQNTIAIFIYLIGQTIALWRKLSKIEQKLSNIQEHNKTQDEDIRNIKRAIIRHLQGAAEELIT